jgi:hypothetical protein
MQGAIQSEKLKASKASLYLIFNPVTPENLLQIERARECG